MSASRLPSASTVKHLVQYDLALTKKNQADENPKRPVRTATRGVDPELFVPDLDPAFQKISGPDLTLTVKIYF
jgi:hypothetical protein